tara:strand:+ start:8912 stop:9469 length:558 start_codon:yes stop_codon:yes gene_type:complete
MILDIVVAIILAFGFYVGFQRGLIRTVFDTASLLVGIVAALKLSPIAINLVDSVISGKPAVNFIIGIVLTFVIVMALVRYIGKKLEDLFKAINLNSINKIAGGALQAAFFALLVSLGLYLLDNLKLLEEKTKSESISYTLLEPLPRHSQDVFVKFKPMFKGFWEKTVELMDEIKQKAEDAENKPN